MTAPRVPGRVDLEERTLAFVAALGASPQEAAALLAHGAACEVPGLGLVGRDAFLRHLAAVRGRHPGLAFTAGTLAVKRNVAFVSWTLAPEGHGVLVLSWDQSGRVAHLALHTDAAALRP